MRNFFLILFVIISFKAVAHSPFDGKMPRDVFPAYVKVAMADGREIVLGRPISLVNNHYVKTDTYPNLIDQVVSLNHYYGAFRELNGDKNIVSNTKIDFIDGVAHVNDHVFKNDDVHLYGEGYRFVMDENGNFYIGEQTNHEGILGGQYVMCAGSVKFDETGKIVYMDSQTGHYYTIKLQLQQAVRYLAGIDALAEDAVIMPFGVRTIFSVSEFLNQTLQQLDESAYATSIQNMNASFVACKDLLPAKAFDDKVYIKKAKSHTRKIIDVLTHKDLLVHVEHELIHRHGFFGVPGETVEALQQKLADLKANRPYPEMYDQVLEKEDALRPRAHA